MREGSGDAAELWGSQLRARLASLPAFRAKVEAPSRGKQPPEHVSLQCKSGRAPEEAADVHRRDAPQHSPPSASPETHSLPAPGLRATSRFQSSIFACFRFSTFYYTYSSFSFR